MLKRINKAICSYFGHSFKVYKSGDFVLEVCESCDYVKRTDRMVWEVADAVWKGE